MPPEVVPEGVEAFTRYACKMATGSGKTTVMGMLAAWSILNKVTARGDARFSDVVLVVCPNVTIRERLAELDPNRGDASIYRTRDLVPPHLMPQPAARARARQELARVRAQGDERRRRRCRRTACRRRSGRRSRSARRRRRAAGGRYMTEQALEIAVGQGDCGSSRTADPTKPEVVVEETRYVESDTTLMQRLLGREVGGKQNILVLNDEAHHAYRIRQDAAETAEEDAEWLDEERADELALRVDGLDRRARPHPQASADQLLRRPLGDAVLPRPRGRGHEPALPVGRERLRPDRRDRVGAGEDPAARALRPDRRGAGGVLQHLALDHEQADRAPSAAASGRTRSPRRC